MFSLCCNNGKIKLPANTLPPKGIFDLFFGNDELSKKFLQNIRTYNNMFCFTSMGGKIDTSVNKGGAPPVFRLSGQNYHLMGSLLPEEGKAPHFAQLYIYDTTNEKNNRINAVRGRGEQDDIHVEIVNVIQKELDKNNVLVKSFRMAMSELDSNPCAGVKIKLLGKCTKDARTYNLPQVSGTTLIVGDLDTSIGECDIVVQAKGGQLQRISELNPSYLPLQYPLLFPYGEDGYREDIAFSNRFVESSTFDDDGYPVYRRRDNGSIVTKNGIALDNRYVVPHNRHLLLKYKAHINVEWCNQSRSIKYLFKYVNKGHDRVTTEFYKTSNDEENGKAIDEINMYYDCTYISPCEAVWRLFGFDIQLRAPSVERLSFHLPNQQSVIFADDDPVENIVNRPTIAQSMFLEWFEANKTFPDARELTYVEMPTRFVWKKDLRKWQPRKKGFSIGRIFYVPPATEEIFYMRCLLNKIRGPTSYADIRTVNGVHYDSFRDACYARGLVDDDNEYVDAIDEASHWALADQLRRLFVTLLMSSCMGKPETVWYDVWPHLSDDAQFQVRKQLHNRDFVLTEFDKMNFALVEIEKLLSIHGKSFKDHPEIPTANFAALNVISNRFIQEELAYDCVEQEKENQELVRQLTEEQKLIYNEVLTDIDRQAGGLFFVYGYGGAGKMFLWRALSSVLRSQSEIVLNVASSGIASLLLPCGRTAHSRFAIPISVNEDSTCNISHDSQLAELIVQSKLIIWDEAPMMHKFCFEALDRTMRDLLGFKNPRSYDMTFGGKTVVFGGDFRQILPVIPKGTRQDIVRANISSSYLWKFCKVFRLTKNLRLRSVQSQIEGKEIEEFAKWIANIGDGTVGNQRDGESDITVPEHLLLKCEDDPIATIVDSTFLILDKGLAIYSINQYMNDHNPAEGKTYLSCDSVCKSDSNVDMLADLHTPEFLNGLRCSRVPNHALTLKVGSPVMLLRNIDNTLGLCNGTRLIVTRLADHVLEGKIMCESSGEERQRDGSDEGKVK
ncbi:PREDICTED: uncharacterized protein LOC109190511 [Ipomoea nil]|uniref:uncharacterized protein LOC109190511 n=1 Tax=Ipomoea nil TaxID=35883 RepID=UPI000901B05E|nr:PREDICTED: uncharacterized protein LOC109190511 [Ipomoea nil]